jgi:hypothetical protein
VQLGTLAERLVWMQPTTDRAVAFYSAYTPGAPRYFGDVYEDATGTGADNQGSPPAGLAGGSQNAALPSPSAIYQPTRDRIVAFVVGGDGALYDKTYNGAWESLGTP